MKKILVTGSDGFIGHNVVQLLKEHSVIGLDNNDCYGSLNRQLVDRLTTERVQLTTKSKNFIRRTGDINSVDDIQDGLTAFRPEVVIHLASYPRQYEVSLNLAAASATMTTGLLNVLESTKYSCEKFVFISSSMVYGDFPNFAMENHPLAPNTLYGILKQTGERLVENYCKLHDIAYTIIRPSAVYGPRDVSNRLVGKFLQASMNGETLFVKGRNEILDFTYVEDLAKGIVQAALCSISDNETYNLTRSDAQCRTIMDAAELVISLTNKGNIVSQERDDSFPQRGNLSIYKAMEDFDYNPTTNIEIGFRKYYDWLSTFQQR